MIKQTKVLLIALYGPMQPINAEPLAIETLGGAITHEFGNEVTVELRTLRESQDLREGKRLIDEMHLSEYDIIGLSIPQSTFELSNQILSYIIEHNIKSLIVLGHALPTHTPEIFLERFPSVLIVRGWGEASLCEIIKNYMTGPIDPSKISNLAFKSDDKIRFSTIDWPLKSPTTLRISFRDYFARVESSRGCHYNACTFCTRPPRAANKPKWFRFPVESVIEQIESFKSNGITDFTFADEDFIGNDIDGAEKIADKLNDMGGMNYSLSLRVDNVFNPNDSSTMAKRRISLLNLLRDSGLSLIFLGVESLSKTQLERYGKGIDPWVAVRAVDQLINLSIPVELGFMLFDPCLTCDELRENINMLKSTSYWMYIDQLFQPLRVQRDTAYERKLKDLGLLGEFQPDTMSYNYSYRDPIISEIACICLKWKVEINHIYISARNLKRTSFGRSPEMNFVYAIRSLQFDMLMSLIGSFDSTSSLDLVSQYNRRLLDLVNQLKNDLQGDSLSPVEQELLNSIKAFLSKETSK
jgi:radical SAM superfamily enzyme YgiQ (UPF0313 family)